MPPIDTRRLRDVPRDPDLADAIRANLLQALYSRFGERIAEMAARSLGTVPLTTRDAGRILKAAATLAAARKLAFASARLKSKDFVWADSDRPRVADCRHRELLAFCATLGRDPDALHDRVRVYLEKRGFWPILNAGELEAQAKPAARMLAAWDAGGTV
jgi:hypothetical protein